MLLPAEAGDGGAAPANTGEQDRFSSSLADCDVESTLQSFPVVVFDAVFSLPSGKTSVLSKTHSITLALNILHIFL